MQLFTRAFWATTLEVVLIAFLASFAGSQVFVAGFSAKNFLAATATAATAALAAFLKQLGGVQTAKALAAMNKSSTK